MSHSQLSSRKANYGIDAPRVVLTMLGVGIAGIALWLISTFTLLSNVFQPVFWGVFGASFLLIAAGFVWSSKIGKLRLRDNILGRIDWHGDEMVLDVGCGRGLLLIGAAKRLTSGKAVGVDIWSKVDLSGNNPAATLENAKIEGVTDRVEVRDADARDLPFPESTFDLVLSSSVIHNIKTKEGREKAISEMARVLKPGGRIYLSDIFHLREYVELLKRMDMSDVQRLRVTFLFFQPGVLITAKKPLNS
ncbi:MAG TPA: class I SAM-dependent methyltransferase [Candidatus Bathyarchaeia archaeon]|nr:class I SAM-dependent methyltransferase [Candidatus Bathyarchaeia archaeon]